MEGLYSKIHDQLTGSAGVIKVEQLGSSSSDQDAWSDLDVGIVTNDKEFDSLFPATNWIEKFGDIYAIYQSSAMGVGTTRVVFNDLTRVDFKFVTSGTLLDSDDSPPSRDEYLITLGNLANDFRFEAVLAVSKLGRNDKLIAAHLVLGLEQKCLVLAMMLRDQQHGTVHHRHGGHLNDVTDRLGGGDMPERIRVAASVFGELAVQLDPEAKLDWSPMLKYLNKL